MMLVQEAIHQLRLFSRRPAAVFFVVAMPLVLLIVLTQLFGNEKIQGLGLNTAQFYTPALSVFGGCAARRWWRLDISRNAAGAEHVVSS